LLIVDGIATNRVALKVKLSAAWYDVTVAATGAEALTMMRALQPNQMHDLVVVNDTLPDMDLTTFCGEMSGLARCDLPPALALCDNSVTRAALLDAGAEDVLPLPLNADLLIARIRSVLRAHASEAEWRLRDGTSRALGFAEAQTSFLPRMRVVHLHAARRPAADGLSDLQGVTEFALTSVPLDAVMHQPHVTKAASVVILELPGDRPEPGLAAISDLRAHAATRHVAMLVTVPEGRADLAARALDLGANETTLHRASARELALRLKRLHARHHIANKLRATVKNGAEAAIRDPLTGLYNRRYALPYLERVAEQAQSAGRPFAVMIADLDHFKQINDWYGHVAGDAVLTDCAHRFTQNMRAFDLVARIGGEEFLFVLPGTDQSAARRAATRLCKLVSETPFELPGTPEPVFVTVSIGLAMASGDARSDSRENTSDLAPHELLAQADKALYRAKELGRNRYILSRSAAA